MSEGDAPVSGSARRDRGPTRRGPPRGGSRTPSPSEASAAGVPRSPLVPWSGREPARTRSGGREGGHVVSAKRRYSRRTTRRRSRSAHSGRGAAYSQSFEGQPRAVFFCVPTEAAPSEELPVNDPQEVL